MKKHFVLFIFFSIQLNFAQNNLPIGSLQINNDGVYNSLFNSAGVARMYMGFDGQTGYFNFGAHTGGGQRDNILYMRGSDGNVGIGTAAPAGKLHINNTGISGQLDYNLIVQKTEVADNNKSAVGLLFATECCGAFGKSSIVHERTGGYGIGNLHFLNNNIIGASNPTLLDSKMTINSNGNVGIGTTNPSAKLDVTNSLNTSSNEVIASLTRAQTGTGGSSIVRFGYHNTGDFEVNSGYSSTGHRLGSYFDLNLVNNHQGGDHGGINFATNGSVKVALKVNGNVGIGTTNPTNKLDVNGTIHSKEVKVDMNGWPDYVFKKEYDLPTLEEVEKQITEKGHLANIPSEQEVLKNGINLGEMNSKLLQKIEELTLYVLEMKKESENIKNVNEKQNEEIQYLKKQISQK